MAANVARLKAYKEKLVLFPRKNGKAKSGDSKDVDVSNTVKSLSAALPITPVAEGVYEISKSDVPKAVEGGAYAKLRLERANKRQQGQREKRAREKAEAEANKK